MLSISAHVVWAVPVHPVELGAHFEGYIKLQPTIQTLRLCNRFGKGEKATVVRLPIELIHAIEDCLIQEERKNQHRQWLQDFKCWSHQCGTLDHYTREQIAGWWNDYLIDHGRENECEKYCKHVTKELSEKQRRKLENYMYDDMDDYMYGSQAGDDLHYEREGTWSGKIAEVVLSEASKDSLRKDFGLDVWMSHSHKSHDKRGRVLFDYNESTLTYLVLPNAAGFEPDFGKLEYGTGSQSGLGLILAPPTRPSEASLKRFPRAMKILGLTPTALHVSSQGLEEGQRDVNSKGTGSSDTPEDGSNLSVPRLRLLVSSDFQCG